MKLTDKRPPIEKEPLDCPADNTLSAFIEGNLTREHREQVFYHLRRCNDCYQLVVETVKLTRELPSEIKDIESTYTITEPLSDPPRRRVPALFHKIGKWQNVALVSPIAAAFLFVLLFKGSPGWRTDEVLKALKEQGDISVISSSLSIEESNRLTLGFNRGLSDQQLAFKTGSLLSRLEISRVAGDMEKRKVFSSQISSLLDKSDATKMLIIKDQSNIQFQIENIEKHFFNSSFNFYFKLGVFVESGKAYSLVDKSELFDKNYLNTLQQDPQFKKLPPGVVSRFNQIENLLNKNTVAQNHEIIYKLLQDIQQILS